MARNARFTLDPSSVVLIATGKVSPAVDWSIDVAPGAQRAQRRDDYGMPVWLVDCLDESDPDANRSAVVGVEIASPVAPSVGKYERLEVTSVQTALYVNKANQLVINYTATLKTASKAAAA